jgi:hypothetical protein
MEAQIEETKAQAQQRLAAPEMARQMLEARNRQAMELQRQRALDRENEIRVAASLRPPAPPPATSMVVVQDTASPTGWSHLDARTNRKIPGAPAPSAGARAEERAEQRSSMADYATLLTDRLNTLVTDNPRSATGIFAPLVRATEAVVNSVAPGTLGSQATISAQTKEQLITVLSQIRGGGMGRLSNQDMRRVDTAIGQINSGTPEGMAQGLSDTYDLIDALQGKPPRSNAGKTRPIGRPGVPPPPAGFRVDQ